MKQLLSLISDGSETNGVQNISTMRVTQMLVVLYLLGTHAALTLKLGIMQPFTGDELTLLFGVLAGKLIQNSQEKTDEPVTRLQTALVGNVEQTNK